MPPLRIALWVATLGGIALMVRSVLGDPVPLPYAVAALLTYFLGIGVGILVPQLEVFGDVLWRGPPRVKEVALTFDDGPHPVHSRRVLAVLRARGVQATFFVVGRKVLEHPELAREIVEAGHSLGLHSYHHDRLLALRTPAHVAEDIQRTQREVEAATGLRVTLFRPPLGYVSPRITAGAERASVTLVAWSARARDGLRSTTVASATRRLTRGLRPGAILLLHDAAERDDFEPIAPEVLPGLLDAIEAQGYRVVPLTRFLEVEPG